MQSDKANPKRQSESKANPKRTKSERKAQKGDWWSSLFLNRACDRALITRWARRVPSYTNILRDIFEVINAIMWQGPFSGVYFFSFFLRIDSSFAWQVFTYWYFYNSFFASLRFAFFSLRFASLRFASLRLASPRFAFFCFASLFFRFASLFFA